MFACTCRNPDVRALNYECCSIISASLLTMSQLMKYIWLLHLLAQNKMLSVQILSHYKELPWITLAPRKTQHHTHHFHIQIFLVQNSMSHFSLRSMKLQLQNLVTSREYIRFTSQYSTQHVLTMHIFSDVYNFQKASCFPTAMQNFHNNYKKHSKILDKRVPAATQQSWPNSEEPYLSTAILV